MSKQPRRCSFCGKSDSEVAKLIAGPSAFICNDCVDICNEILEADGDDGLAREARAPRYLARARDELEAARMLATSGRHRVAVECARHCVRSALLANGLAHGLYSVRETVGSLLAKAMKEDTALGRLHDLRLTTLLSRYEFVEDADETDARYAIETAEGILSYIVRHLGVG